MFSLVAQPQGDLLVCIWGNLVKFQGAQVASKFDVLPHWDAVFLCSLHARNETLLLMSQSAIKLAVGADLVSLSKFVLDCTGRPVAMKNGLNWGNGFVIGDAKT